MEVTPLTCTFCGRELETLHYYVKNKMICDECMTNLYSPRLILGSSGSTKRLWNFNLKCQEAFGLMIPDLKKCGWYLERKTMFKGVTQIAGFCRDIPEIFHNKYSLRYENKLQKCLRIPENQYYYGGTEMCSGRFCYFLAVKKQYEGYQKDFKEEKEWTPEKMYQIYQDRLGLT